MDKPKGVTSFDLVREWRKKLSVKKVGHAGTLDPLATGLMILAVGEGTKLLEFLLGCDKEYQVVAEFGAVSDTFDADGQLAQVSNKKIEQNQVEMALRSFLGEIDQVPPKYSALKINGRRACDILRSGGEVEMKSRTVRIDCFDLLEYDWPEVKFSVACGSGTYIRSLIHDLGAQLEVGAYVKELRRTRVGHFDLSMVSDQLLTLEEVARRVFPVWHLSEQQKQGLENGKTLNFDLSELTVAFYQDELIGIVEPLSSGCKYRKLIVR